MSLNRNVQLFKKSDTNSSQESKTPYSQKCNKETLNFKLIELLSSKNPDEKKVSQLLKEGADANHVTYFGFPTYAYKTPLMIAATAGATDIIKHLLASGADINKSFIKDEKCVHAGRTALWYSLYENMKDDAAKLLLEKGADLSIVDENKDTILNRAILEHRTTIVELLLKNYRNKIDIEHRNNEEKTPLMIAAEQAKDTSIVTLLLNAGADATACDKDDNTSAELAAMTKECLLDDYNRNWPDDEKVEVRDEIVTTMDDIIELLNKAEEGYTPLEKTVELSKK